MVEARLVCMAMEVEAGDVVLVVGVDEARMIVVVKVTVRDLAEQADASISEG